MPETTTFADIKFTETVENYRFEKQEYTFNEGDVISLPHFLASKFVNRWNHAKYDSDPYEVTEREYDDVAARTRNEPKDAETCDVEKSDGEVCERERPCPYHDEE